MVVFKCHKSWVNIFNCCYNITVDIKCQQLWLGPFERLQTNIFRLTLELSHFILFLEYKLRTNTNNLKLKFEYLKVMIFDHSLWRLNLCFFLSTFVSIRILFCNLISFSYSGISDKCGGKTSLIFLTPDKPPEVERLNNMSDFSVFFSLHQSRILNYIILITFMFIHIFFRLYLLWGHSTSCCNFIPPQLPLITLCKAADHNRDWKGQDKDSAQGTQTTY